MEAINSAHIENTKDKLALCMELKEVCSIKEQLNNNLDAEVQKSSSLGQSKKELENATNSKVYIQCVHRLVFKKQKNIPYNKYILYKGVCFT